MVINKTCSKCGQVCLFDTNAKRRSKASGFFQNWCWACYKITYRALVAKKRATPEGKAKANASAIAWCKSEEGRAWRKTPEVRADRIRRVLERRHHKKQATPNWACKERIIQIYKEAKIKTNETGVEHVVDHIIPLKGKLVSGLHVETNLQVITAKENSIKSNDYK